jgi:hypothetical protein
MALSGVRDIFGYTIDNQTPDGYHRTGFGQMSLLRCWC